MIPLRLLTRTATALLVGAAAALGATNACAAYPDRPITIIVPYPVGGATDTLARGVGAKISETFKQSVVIENRTGGSGFIGMGMAARAPADGYTILFGAVADAAIYSAAAIQPPAVNLEKDFTPLAGIASAPHLLVVPETLPAKNAQQLIDFLKQAPGKHNFASIGIGTLSHLEGELLMLATGVKIVHVPYRGGSQALVDLVSGSSSMMFLSAPNAIPQVKNGKIKVLAVASDKRLALLPDVPTLAESGVSGFNAENRFGFFAVKGTPPAIIEQVSQAMGQALQQPDLKSRLEDQGMSVNYANPTEFARQTSADFRLYEDIVKRADIKLD